MLPRLVNVIVLREMGSFATVHDVSEVAFVHKDGMSAGDIGKRVLPLSSDA